MKSQKNVYAFFFATLSMVLFLSYWGEILEKLFFKLSFCLQTLCKQS